MHQPIPFSLSFRIISYILYMYARFVLATSKIIRVDDEPVKKLRSISPIILTLWHEHFFSAMLAHRNQHFHPIVSLSRDGEIANFVSTRFGLPCVRGSSSRGGIAARKELIQLLTDGKSIALTIDGPRGPRHKAKPGCIDLSIQSGFPIVPLSCVTKNCWILNKSWDKTRIAKPFSKIYLIYGPPIFPDEKNFDEQIVQLEIVMMNLEARAKQLIDEKN